MSAPHPDQAQAHPPAPAPMPPRAPISEVEEFAGPEVGEFARRGFLLLPGFFPFPEIMALRQEVVAVQGEWEKSLGDAWNPALINSAYLTAKRYAAGPRGEAGRKKILRFVSQRKLTRLARLLVGPETFFLNTQLFFNPGWKASAEAPENAAGPAAPGAGALPLSVAPTARRPYWHRDIQYLGLSEAEQRERMKTDIVLHCRVPLAPDPGLDFIPGTHLRWDTEEEIEVRLERNGRRNFEDLPGRVRVPHGPGDLLLFSAHLLHKGVYDGERLSFDILFANFRESAETRSEFGHFPADDLEGEFEDGAIFA